MNSARGGLRGENKSYTLWGSQRFRLSQIRPTTASSHRHGRFAPLQQVRPLPKKRFVTASAKFSLFKVATHTSPREACLGVSRNRTTFCLPLFSLVFSGVRKLRLKNHFVGPLATSPSAPSLKKDLSLASAKFIIV